MGLDGGVGHDRWIGWAARVGYEYGTLYEDLDGFLGRYPLDRQRSARLSGREGHRVTSAVRCICCAPCDYPILIDASVHEHSLYCIRVQCFIG